MQRVREVDVLGDVLHLFGSIPFDSAELQSEMDHYARIMGARAPHPTAVGKRLAALGYRKTGRGRGEGGRKVSVYRFKMKAIVKRA